MGGQHYHTIQHHTWKDKIIHFLSSLKEDITLTTQPNGVIIYSPSEATANLYGLQSGRQIKYNIPINYGTSNHIYLDNQTAPIFIQVIIDGLIAYQQSFFVNSSNQLISGGK